MSHSVATGVRYLGANFVWQSGVFRKVIDRIVQVSSCAAPVLIVGETGTGKELVARALHYLGERCNAAFIPVNCGSLPDSLVESEIYGHTRGAFTDAVCARRGLVQQAEGGTLFLDEVEALSPRAQVSLLRFLEDATYRPVGSERIHHADVRLIAATNVDLTDQVKLRNFREDLMYRLDVLKIELPPLRERREDIQLLVRHFLKKAADLTNSKPKSVSDASLRALCRYDWPGNVRELEHTVLKVHVLSCGEHIGVNDLLTTVPEVLASCALADLPVTHSLREAKRMAADRVEHQYLDDLLLRAGGNISEAARLSGMQRASLSKLVKRHGLSRHSPNQNRIE